MSRSEKIIRTSIIGIVVNVVLVLFKMTVGILANSIAVILDAVNNLGDALSSMITIIGTKLAGKAPDKKHPYGYGRIEYLTSVVIAVIVLMAGVSSLRESFDKVIHPQKAEYSVVSLIIIAAAVITKFLIGRYTKSVGEQINASSLVASGSDAYFDSVLSFSTLVAAVISMVWHITLEGILGVIISIIIIKAGIEILLETLNSIIGVRADKELSTSLKGKINSFEEVRGTYDLTLHNYGPSQIIGSAHIEVDDTMTAKEIHKLTRKIMETVYEEFDIILTVGIYASNTSDDEIMKIRQVLEQDIAKYPEILQMHGFYAESETKIVTFDLVIDFDADTEKISQKVVEDMKKEFPTYQFLAVLDSDYSD